MKKLTLVYGMRLVNEDEDGSLAAVEHGHVLLETGRTRQVTMHTIEGSVEQIKVRLLESIDAFFELQP
ncbi:MAG TPA: allantoinase [Blastocatellia bacterium]|nr:allantoinase [Blastocatellia bacterium]